VVGRHRGRRGADTDPGLGGGLTKFSPPRPLIWPNSALARRILRAPRAAPRPSAPTIGEASGKTVCSRRRRSLSGDCRTAPRSKVVRGFSFFGVSFVYVVFEDGTDLYWARSRVLEYLNFAAKRLPEGVIPSAQLVNYIYVDMHDRDIGGYVAGAQRALAQKVRIPPGYRLEWSGQFEYLERAKAKLAIVVPITLVIIFVLLYLNFGRLTETLIVMLSVPFALVGGVWLMAWMQFNMSVAVAVGFIALAGVAAETGVVMLIYLDPVGAQGAAGRGLDQLGLHDLAEPGVFGSGRASHLALPQDRRPGDAAHDEQASRSRTRPPLDGDLTC
jgi:hypothetical protein